MIIVPPLSTLQFSHFKFAILDIFFEFLSLSSADESLTLIEWIGLTRVAMRLVEGNVGEPGAAGKYLT